MGGIVLGFAVIAMAAAVIFPAVRDALIYDTVTDIVSPSGEKTVTLMVDYVSRPYVFYGSECIFEFEETGFTETVYWNVEWLSEDEIKLSSAEELYFIDVPD